MMNRGSNGVSREEPATDITADHSRLAPLLSTDKNAFELDIQFAAANITT